MLDSRIMKGQALTMPSHTVIYDLIQNAQANLTSPGRSQCNKIRQKSFFFAANDNTSDSNSHARVSKWDMTPHMHRSFTISSASLLLHNNTSLFAQDSCKDASQSLADRPNIATAVSKASSCADVMNKSEAESQSNEQCAEPDQPIVPSEWWPSARCILIKVLSALGSLQLVGADSVCWAVSAETSHAWQRLSEITLDVTLLRGSLRYNHSGNLSRQTSLHSRSNLPALSEKEKTSFLQSRAGARHSFCIQWRSLQRALESSDGLRLPGSN